MFIFLKLYCSVERVPRISLSLLRGYVISGMFLILRPRLFIVTRITKSLIQAYFSAFSDEENNSTSIKLEKYLSKRYHLKNAAIIEITSTFEALSHPYNVTCKHFIRFQLLSENMFIFALIILVFCYFSKFARCRHSALR